MKRKDDLGCIESRKYELRILKIAPFNIFFISRKDAPHCASMAAPLQRRRIRRGGDSAI